MSLALFPIRVPVMFLSVKSLHILSWVVQNGKNYHIVLKADCSKPKKKICRCSVLKDEKLLAAPLISMSSTPTLEILRKTLFCNNKTSVLSQKTRIH